MDTATSRRAVVTYYAVVDTYYALDCLCQGPPLGQIDALYASYVADTCHVKPASGVVRHTDQEAITDYVFVGARLAHCWSHG